MNFSKCLQVRDDCTQKERIKAHTQALDVCGCVTCGLSYVCVCGVCVYVSWSREQLIRPFQAAWDTWEQVNYGSHTHTYKPTETCTAGWS